MTCVAIECVRSDQAYLGCIWVLKGLTSELRLLVSVPGASCRSRRIVEVPSRAASCLATERPTTPAPMTFVRSVSSSN